jgi:hypothetical protein
VRVWSGETDGEQQIERSTKFTGNHWCANRNSIEPYALQP